MSYEFNDEIILNLKDKIDALIQKGNELSKDLSIDEQYSIIKRLISDGIEKAIQNINRDEEIEFSKEELREKKEELKKFVQEYTDKRFSEVIARDWTKNR